MQKMQQKESGREESKNKTPRETDRPGFNE